MLLVILGAGATYDSDPQRPAGRITSPHRPPLTSDLFADREGFGDFIDLYPPVRLLVPRLRAAAVDKTISIESEFERVVAESRDRPAVRRQLVAAQCYIRDVVQSSTSRWAITDAHGVTNYHRLVDEIGAWLDGGTGSVCFVTFNYDTLLETACYDSRGMRLNEIGAYVSDMRTPVIKLHGSVNWRRPTTNLQSPHTGGGAMNAAWLMDNYAGAELSRTYEVADPFFWTQGNPVAVPAIAVPTEIKTTGDCELPDEHLRVLREDVLPTVTNVLVIGWRGRENHWWEMWREMRPHEVRMRVTVVDSDEGKAAEVAQYLQQQGMAQSVAHSQASGFSDFLAGNGMAAVLQ